MMTIEEFFEDVGNPESGLQAEIEKIRMQYGLESLYPIYSSPEQLIWGARGIDVDWRQLMLDLVTFILEKTSVNYNTEETSITILRDGVSEVDLLIEKLIRNYVESHEGRIELENLDEGAGKVVVSMSGTCGGCPSLPVTLKLGVEQMLKARLPWVKSVGLAGSELENSDTVIVITEKAARKIKSLTDEAGLGISGGLRVSVIPGGCSGFQYRYGIEEKPGKDDEVVVRQFEESGNQAAGRVFIDKQSLKFLKDSTLDYVKADDGLSEAFKISNPNAKSSCGCGRSESF